VPERLYYENQGGHVAMVLRALASLVAVVMGVGAVFGAMNTMYAIVAARTREIGPCAPSASRAARSCARSSWNRPCWL
jgi:hypothetical protein